MSNLKKRLPSSGTWSLLLGLLMLAGSGWSVATYLDALGRGLESLVRQQVEFGLEQYGTARKLSLLLQNPSLECLVVKRVEHSVVSHLPHECQDRPVTLFQRLVPIHRRVRFSVAPDIRVVLGISLGSQAVQELATGVGVQLLLLGALLFFLVRSERRVFEADRQLASLISQLSHDLRSPIFALKTAISGLSAGEPAGPELIQLLHLASSRIQNMADDVIYRRRGLLPGRETSHESLKRILNELWIEKRSEYPEFNLQEVMWPKGLSDGGRMNFDGNALKRIFSNMINNSVEAGAKRLSVEVRVTERATTIILEDDGPGFGRANAQKKSGPHLGLGLSHANAQLKFWKARCELPQIGSQIRLTFPTSYR